MPEFQISCLFILYKRQTVLSKYAFEWKRYSLYVIVLCPSSEKRLKAFYIA